MKSTITLLFAILLSVTFAVAQPLNKATPRMMLKTAQAQLDKQDAYQAVVWFDKYYQETKDEAVNRDMAYLHQELRDYKKAATVFKRYLGPRKDKDNEFVEDRYDYGRMLKMTSKYEEALEQFELFLKNSKDEDKRAMAEQELEGLKMAMAWGVTEDDGEEVNGLKIERLKKLNGKYSEYGPVLYKDQIYYAGFGDVDEVIEAAAGDIPYVQIYSASKGAKGWDKGEPLGIKINRDDFQTSNPAFSEDGNTMYFTRALLKGNKVELSKIFYAEENGGSWGAANEVLIGFEGSEFIAKEPSVGELFGKEVLFFVSDMEGGEGGDDIWYATKKGKGVYGDPINLGPRINTPGNEVTPFYREGALYFSSTGLAGLGGLDIFTSTWNGQQWSAPKNMGKGYNTSLDEQSFYLDKEGMNGVFVSNRPRTTSLKAKTCCDDIYAIEIPPVTADLLAMVYKGSDKKALKGATVGIYEVVNNKPGNPSSQSNKKGNEFEFGLGPDISYIAVATKKGYAPDTISFNTLNLKESIAIEKKFYLEKAAPPPPPEPVAPPEPEYEEITVETNTPIRLSNIYYEYNDDKILQEAEGDLSVLLDLMTRYPDMVIELSSHTDYRGKDLYNKSLSQRRAESATNWLLAKGIASERIIPKGYGETSPAKVVADQVVDYPFLKADWVLTEDFIRALQTDEQREGAHQINRRTEFKIISGPTSIKIKKMEKRQKVVAPPKAAPKPKSKTKKRIPKKKTKSKSSKSRGSNPAPVALAKMVFEDIMVDFGTVKRGEKREHTYKFTNQGDVDLIIELVTACDCTTLDYSTEPVGPGEGGSIHAIFDSKDKESGETIDIDIILLNESPDTGYQVVERVSYKFEIEE